MIVRSTLWSDPGVMALREAMRIEIEARYGTPDAEPGPVPTALDTTAFFVAYGDSDRPVGCGAPRELTGEVDCDWCQQFPQRPRARRDRSASSWIHGHPGQPPTGIVVASTKLVLI